MLDSFEAWVATRYSTGPLFPGRSHPLGNLQSPTPGIGPVGDRMSLARRRECRL